MIDFTHNTAVNDHSAGDHRLCTSYKLQSFLTEFHVLPDILYTRLEIRQENKPVCFTLQVTFLPKFIKMDNICSIYS